MTAADRRKEVVQNDGSSCGAHTAGCHPPTDAHTTATFLSSVLAAPYWEVPLESFGAPENPVPGPDGSLFQVWSGVG